MSETEARTNNADRATLLDEHWAIFSEIVSLRVDDQPIRDLRYNVERAGRELAAAQSALAVATSSRSSRIAQRESELRSLEQQLRESAPLEVRALSGAIAITIAELCGASSKYDPELDETMALLRDLGQWCANAWAEDITPAVVEARMLELSQRVPKLHENFLHGLELINDALHPAPRRRFV